MKYLTLSDNETRQLKDYIAFTLRSMEKIVEQDIESLNRMRGTSGLEATAEEFSPYVDRETEALKMAMGIMEDL